jgi:hypothetical protein
MFIIIKNIQFVCSLINYFHKYYIFHQFVSKIKSCIYYYKNHQNLKDTFIQSNILFDISLMLHWCFAEASNNF